jgi:hypothetical protein
MSDIAKNTESSFKDFQTSLNSLEKMVFDHCLFSPYILAQDGGDALLQTPLAILILTPLDT